MFNTLVLRCTLLIVRFLYHILPVLKLAAKFLFWGFICVVTLLLLLLIF